MQEKFITTFDKIELFTRDWLLSENTRRRGAVLVIHGLGEHCGRYAHIAEFLNANEFDVRTYDLRGHGKSSGIRGAISSENALLEDLKSLYKDFAEDRHEELFLLGHSMGGAIALRAAVEKIITPRGLILSSPAVTANLSFTDKLKLKIGRLMPNAAVSNGLKVDYISHDKKVVEDYKNDPLVHRKITPRLANFVIDSGQKSLKKAADFRIPTLLLVAGDDHLVDATGAKRLFDRLPKSSAEMHFYDDLYHEIFNETANRRAEVFADLKNWLIRLT